MLTHVTTDAVSDTKRSGVLIWSCCQPAKSKKSKEIGKSEHLFERFSPLAHVSMFAGGAGPPHPQEGRGVGGRG